ncbi:glutamate receptor ionotropic, kainate 4-like [Palaemon carinicauda]|uniref:glutamate receptor ionotropic, kainate 4-like n=1 Tax=Palaemon carinicauda TaxID=392227 RepID=UPI0035B63DA4
MWTSLWLLLFTIETEATETKLSTNSDISDSFTKLGTSENNLNGSSSGTFDGNSNSQLERANNQIVPFDDVNSASIIGKMVWEAIEEKVPGCHLVMVTPDVRQTFLLSVMQYSSMASQPFVIIELHSFQDENSNDASAALWGGVMTVCQVLVLDLISGDEGMIFRFLELHKVDIWPEAWIFILGQASGAKATLEQDIFRNTLQPVYLGLQESTVDEIKNQNSQKRLFTQSDFKLSEAEGKEHISVYSRCLYCNSGTPAVKLLFRLPIGSSAHQAINPFPDQHSDMHGHKFRVVSMPSFPFNDLLWDTDEPETTVTLLDCLDKRLLILMSKHLNYTYETRAPWDLQWGVGTSTGNWTGMIGTIQYRKADFTTTVAPTPGRNTIIDTTRAYTPDVLAIVSLKPQLLPQYLVIIRPFSGDVWIYILISILVWGFFFWLVQKVLSTFSGKPGMSFSKALFYSWAVILEDAPSRPPTNTPSQVLLGFWLLACLVASTGFRSSLVAHLAVQSKTKPIDSFKDLMARGDFEWGMEARSLTGVPLIYFETTSDPVVKYVYNYMKRLKDHQEAFQRIIDGNFAFIVWEKISQNLIDSYYTDNVGNTPYYISKQGYGIVPYFGWGYGKGAPFRDRFNMVMNRVTEAGLTDQWIKDIMAGRVRQNRRELAEKEGKQENIQIKQLLDDRIVKLRMSHLVGVFLVLFLGSGLSFVVFLLEKFV